jgi:hypothetical protein
LLETNLFDSAELEISRMAAEKTALEYETVVRDCDLGRPDRYHHQERHRPFRIFTEQNHDFVRSYAAQGAIKMAASRAYRKGYLKLSLVTCPVALYPASSQSEKTRFHQINRKTGNRLRQQMVDEETGRVVEGENKGRGYELSRGKYCSRLGLREQSC